MATLLSKILPNDIAYYIYKIAIVEFMQQKITIYTYNLYLIAEKHLYINKIKPSSVYYNDIVLLHSDINKVINLLIIINERYITPYIKFGIGYNYDFKIIIMKWVEQLNNICDNKLIKERYLLNNPHFLLLQKKILLLDNLIN